MRICHDLRVGAARYTAGCDVEMVQNAIDRMYARMGRIEAALRMGLQLGESGRHGDGEDCPTCHFVRQARAAIAAGRD